MEHAGLPFLRVSSHLLAPFPGPFDFQFGSVDASSPPTKTAIPTLKYRSRSRSGQATTSENREIVFSKECRTAFTPTHPQSHWIFSASIEIDAAQLLRPEAPASFPISPPLSRFTQSPKTPIETTGNPGHLRVSWATEGSTRPHTILMLLSLILLTSCAPGPATDSGQASTLPAVGPGIFAAGDGVEIAYTVHRIADPTLVLVHGWMCDQSYWQQQVPVLSKEYGVVTIDLAGHGKSGSDRQDWTIATPRARARR